MAPSHDVCIFKAHYTIEKEHTLKEKKLFNLVICVTYKKLNPECLSLSEQKMVSDGLGSAWRDEKITLTHRRLPSSLGLLHQIITFG